MRLAPLFLLVALPACTDFVIGDRPPAPELQVDPAAASTGPMGRVTLTVTGGVPPYSARATLAPSGGAFEGATDGVGPFVYRAGPREDALDALELTDSAGTKLSASVQVGPRLTAGAPAIAAYDGPFTVTATGGNPPYLLVRADGSTPFTDRIDTPPPASTVTSERLAVEDSAQQRVELTVEFRATLAFPDPLRVQAAQPFDVGAYVAKLGRGVPPFTFGFDPEGNSSGASLTFAGAYVAGANVGVTDLVTVTDGTGKAATLKIAVASPTFPLSGRTLVVGDFDGNGARDLVALGGHSVGEGTAAFIASSAASPPRLVGDVPFRSGITELSRPVALDVDGDGTSDLVTTELLVSPTTGAHSTRITVWSGAPGGLGPALQVLTLDRSEARALTALPPGILPSGGIAVVGGSPIAGCVDGKGNPLQSPLAVFPVVSGRLATTPLCAETSAGAPPTTVSAAFVDTDGGGTFAIAVVQSFYADLPSVALHVLTPTSVGAAQRLNLTGAVAGRQYDLRAAADLDGDLHTDLAMLETNASNATKNYRVAAVLTDCFGVKGCSILSRSSTTYRDLSPNVDAGYPVLVPIRIGPRFELLVGASNGYTLDRMRFLKLGLKEPAAIDLRQFIPSLTSMPRSWDVAVGDFDLDGQDDVAVAGREISLLFGDGTGAFNQGDRFRLPGMGGLAPLSGTRRGVAFGDRGGLALVGLRDGAEQRLFYGAARPELEPDFVIQGSSDRALAFTLSGIVAVSSTGFAPVTADLSTLRDRGPKVFDGYGSWDFLADYTRGTPPANSVEAFSLSGSGVKTSGAFAVGADDEVAGLDDVNGDGVADVLVLTPRYKQSGAGRGAATTLRAYLGSGASFASTATDVQSFTVLANAGPLYSVKLFELTPGSGRRVPVAVFGDDSDATGYTALLAVGDSAGRFCATRTLAGMGRSARSLSAIDLDGDKAPELAVVAFERAILAKVANGKLDTFGLLPRGTRPVGAWTLAPPEVSQPALAIMDAGTESLFFVRSPLFATAQTAASAGLCP